VISAGEILTARILVVDDKEDNVRLLEGMLRVAGYTAVDSTTDPTAVCDLYAQNRYSLILLDLQMPVMDGFEVMEALRQIAPHDYLPIIVITAQPSHKLRALEAGAKDFVGKPFDMAELRARVHNVLQVRLLHRQATDYVRELEESREVIRIKTLEEERRREEEMGLAEETQNSLLPASLPEFAGYRIRARNRPTRYVGGDFYDFVPLDAGEWMGVLADVSGKGIPAALLSSMVLGAVNMEFRARTPMAAALARLNLLLRDKSLAYQFVTMFIFAMKADGAGQFISAGHNSAYVFRTATAKIEKLRPEHFVLGMFDGAAFQTRNFRLDSGDILFVYSDGLTDAENPQGAMLGEARLLDLIRGAAGRGSQALESELVEMIDGFTQGEPQTDDITFLIVEKMASPMPAAD
jgi:serine phosphatase RsbU (regulator of sigma subunit)